MSILNTSGVIRSFMMGIFFSAALLVWGAREALAYCVYNDTDQYISEVAGEFCMRCLNTSMSPHDKACCPGGKSGCRGETRITVRIPNTVYQSGAHYKHFGARVTAHGWVRIQGSMYAPSGVVYNDDGALLWSGPLIDGK
ncbi:MAG: hypothetical protein K4571_20610 [Deltaproteobacteria bacterium]